MPLDWKGTHQGYITRLLVQSKPAFGTPYYPRKNMYNKRITQNASMN